MNDLLFWTVLISLCCTFYMICSTKQKRDFQILQTPMHSLTDSMLHEKYPILVHDRVGSLPSMLKGVFRFQYLFQKELVGTEGSIKVGTRFLLMRNRGEGDAHLQLGLKERSMIPMIADSQNVLILPAGWYFQLEAPELWELIALNDLSHMLFFAN
mgnify:CR=1 FL=1